MVGRLLHAGTLDFCSPAGAGGGRQHALPGPKQWEAALNMQEHLPSALLQVQKEPTKAAVPAHNYTLQAEGAEQQEAALSLGVTVLLKASRCNLRCHARQTCSRLCI